MTSQEARARVARGAALLDEKKPGWAQSLEHQCIEMSSCFRCVLGWLYGRYAAGRQTLGIDKDPQEYGFYTESWEFGDYEMLGHCWRDAIAERVTAAPVVEWTHREMAEAT